MKVFIAGGTGTIGVPLVKALVTAGSVMALGYPVRTATQSGLALAQIPFILNILWSMFFGKKVVSDNPWQATTLEWATPTPPPHGNFEVVPTVFRGPYEYSNPAEPNDHFRRLRFTERHLPQGAYEARCPRRHGRDGRRVADRTCR